MTVLTGFLGSGKTTVLNRLVASSAMKGAAVIINEFGEIGLDHELVKRSDETLVLLDNGCVCCSVRDDLVTTLLELDGQQRDGWIPPINRVVIETTGLADPAPIVHTLMTDPDLIKRFALGAVVTTVDAVNGLSSLRQHDQALKQVGLADLLLVTKADISGAGTPVDLLARLGLINPGVRILEVAHGGIAPDVFFGAAAHEASWRTADVQKWLNAEAFADTQRHAHSHQDHTDDRAAHSHRHLDESINSFCVTRDDPIPLAKLGAWLDMVKAMRGDDLLRVKGIINVVEQPDRPVVIHGVQHVFHPPLHLDAWPSEDRRTRIVFITRNIDKDVIEDTLQIFERRARK